jgi:ectoine hydroxylase-related dioxygenase (phytanoyl-CoA dioxygenase family)
MTDYPIRADDGHGIVGGIFTPAEMRDVLKQLSHAALDRTKAGARHLLRVDVVRQLADDPRILSLARLFVGAAATPFRATLFAKSPANWLVAWHQDTALPLRRKVTTKDWGAWSTKAGVLYAHAPAWALEQVVALRVSLDDSTKDNGPLRALPDTHRLGLLSDSQIQSLARERQPLDCLASCGGIVAMRPLTVHASSKSIVPQPRRVLHIEYAAAIDLGSGIEVAVA